MYSNNTRWHVVLKTTNVDAYRAMMTVVSAVSAIVTMHIATVLWSDLHVACVTLWLLIAAKPGCIHQMQNSAAFDECVHVL